VAQQAVPLLPANSAVGDCSCCAGCTSYSRVADLRSWLLFAPLTCELAMACSSWLAESSWPARVNTGPAGVACTVAMRRELVAGVPWGTVTGDRVSSSAVPQAEEEAAAAAAAAAQRRKG
jgi:hypothetical protein